MVIAQEIVEAENRINFLAGRYPQPIERQTVDFINLNLHSLSAGVPAQLLQNRSDIRQAERELSAAGLEVQVARANFYPSLNLSAGVGYRAFNSGFLFSTPASLAYNAFGDVVAPLINRAPLVLFITADQFAKPARKVEGLNRRTHPYNSDRIHFVDLHLHFNCDSTFWITPFGTHCLPWRENHVESIF